MGGFRTIRLTLLKPARVSVSPEVKVLGLVDRALPKHKKADIIESILTTEGYNEDKQGRQQILAGLNLLYHNHLNLKEK